MIVDCRLRAGALFTMVFSRQHSIVNRQFQAFSPPWPLKKGRPVRLRAYQAGLWGCYIIPDGSVGSFVAVTATKLSRHRDLMSWLRLVGCRPIRSPVRASHFLAPGSLSPALLRLTLCVPPRLCDWCLRGRVVAPAGAPQVLRITSVCVPSVPQITYLNARQCQQVSQSGRTFLHMC